MKLNKLKQKREIVKMKTLLIAGLLCALRANATLVQQVVIGPDGTVANGSVMVTISAPCTSGSSYLGNKPTRINFLSGAFSAVMTPNQGCVPSGAVSGDTFYTAAWSVCPVGQLNATPTNPCPKTGTTSNWVERWYVPITGATLEIKDIILSVTPQTLVDKLLLAQLDSGGAANGNCLVYSVSAKSYLPAVCGGGTSSGAAGTVQVAGSSVGSFSGDPRVAAVAPTGGAYFSATADVNGGGPNTCPAWFDTCPTPAALILNGNFSGALLDGGQIAALYGNYTYTGAGGASLDGTDLFVGVSPTSTGDISQLIGAGIQLTNNGSGSIATMYGTYYVLANNGPGVVSKAYINFATFGFANPGTITDGIEFWGADLAGSGITNPYYSWFDSQGVRRVKEDSTFDSIGQAIEALYNPQFTKYTPGAVNFERIILGQWHGNVAEIGTEAGGTGTLRPLALIGASVQAPGGAASLGVCWKADGKTLGNGTIAEITAGTCH